MIIEETWNRLAAELPRGPGVSVDNMRMAYVAGLYAASASLNAERTEARDISEAAFRLERMNNARPAAYFSTSP